MKIKILKCCYLDQEGLICFVKPYFLPRLVCFLYLSLPLVIYCYCRKEFPDSPLTAYLVSSSSHLQPFFSHLLVRILTLSIPEMSSILSSLPTQCLLYPGCHHPFSETFKNILSELVYVSSMLMDHRPHASSLDLPGIIPFLLTSFWGPSILPVYLCLASVALSVLRC